VTERLPGQRDELPALLWFAAGALLYLSFGFTEMMGSDLWWHIAGGREIFEQGSLWLRDDWSYSAYGERWHNHEWGADVVFWLWTRAFGVASLVVWKWLMIVAIFALLQRVLQRLTGHAGAALLCASAAVAIAAPFLDLRPQLYTLLGVVLLLNLALEREPRLHELLPLFLLWVNLHGGFLFGLMLLGILAFPWRQLRLPALRRYVLLMLACVAVTLLNPDGILAYAYPLEYALNADSPYRGLAEWRPPFEAGGIRSPYYKASLIAGAALGLAWLLPTARRRLGLSPALPLAAALTGCHVLNPPAFRDPLRDRFRAAAGPAHGLGSAAATAAAAAPVHPAAGGGDRHLPRAGLPAASPGRLPLPRGGVCLPACGAGVRAAQRAFR